MEPKITTRAIEKLRAKAAEAARHASFPSSSDASKAAWRQADDARLEAFSALAVPVEAALKAANGKAAAQAITTFNEVLDVADEAERTLRGRGATLANIVGAEVAFTPAGPSAKSYKYAARSTRITLRRVADGWRLAKVEAVDVYPKQPQRIAYRVSAGAAADIQRAAFDGITVDHPAAVAA